jgi:hypothetical protein
MTESSALYSLISSKASITELLKEIWFRLVVSSARKLGTSLTKSMILLCFTTLSIAAMADNKRNAERLFLHDHAISHLHDPIRRLGDRLIVCHQNYRYPSLSI